MGIVSFGLIAGADFFPGDMLRLVVDLVLILPLESTERFKLLLILLVRIRGCEVFSDRFRSLEIARAVRSTDRLR